MCRLKMIPDRKSQPNRSRTRSIASVGKNRRNRASVARNRLASHVELMLTQAWLRDPRCRSEAWRLAVQTSGWTLSDRSPIRTSLRCPSVGSPVFPPGRITAASFGPGSQAPLPQWESTHLFFSEPSITRGTSLRDEGAAGFGVWLCGGDERRQPWQPSQRPPVIPRRLSFLYF